MYYEVKGGERLAGICIYEVKEGRPESFRTSARGLPLEWTGYRRADLKPPLSFG